MTVTIESVRQRAESDARSRGYHLNPDQKFLQDLFEGLKTNEDRYGYPSCPCRPGTGVYEQDRDVICPCDYRDPDVAEFGACYCSLYVNKDVFDSGKPTPIPERRPAEKMFPELAPTPAVEVKPAATAPQPTQRKLWYCKQCGYVVFREDAPYICPICKAKKEFFAEVKLEIQQKTG
ncbi:MAG: ferredoxin:glutaredoxin reductase [Candidatus Bathyarchaeota archaeon]|nr:ferredoxin:glutaredoxin reductase [Candidatus Bathyarchaeota archaeon]